MAAFTNTAVKQIAPFLDKLFSSGHAPGQPIYFFEGSSCVMQNSVSLYIPVPPFGRK
jgi:hypothetical protein